MTNKRNGLAGLMILVLCLGSLAAQETTTQQSAADNALTDLCDLIKQQPDLASERQLVDVIDKAAELGRPFAAEQAQHVVVRRDLGRQRALGRLLAPAPLHEQHRGVLGQRLVDHRVADRVRADQRVPPLMRHLVGHHELEHVVEARRGSAASADVWVGA